MGYVGIKGPSGIRTRGQRIKSPMLYRWAKGPRNGGEGRIRTYCVSYVPDLQSDARPPSEQLPQKLVGDERIELPTLAV